MIYKSENKYKNEFQNLFRMRLFSYKYFHIFFMFLLKKTILKND